MGYLKTEYPLFAAADEIVLKLAAPSRGGRARARDDESGGAEGDELGGGGDDKALAAAADGYNELSPI